MAEVIHSIKDEHIVLARSLRSRKGRLLHGKMLLEGEQVITWALEHNLCVDFILSAGDIPSGIREKLKGSNCEFFTVSEGIIKKVTDTKYVIPLVGVAGMPSSKFDEHADFLLVLDDLQDFGNIGTILRTCRAFGIRDVVSTTGDLDLFQRKIVDASRGSVFSTRLECFSGPAQAITQLKSRGYQIVATSPRGDNLQSLLHLKQQPVALVVGNESVGVHPSIEENADFLVQIPMRPDMESLNVGVAAGISIYEIKLKQVLAMIEKQIKSTLGRELNVAGMLVQRALDAELRQATALTSRQVIFMMVLRCDGEMPVEGMCRQFGILPSEVEEFLSPLLKDALLTRTDGQLRLTDRGEETLGKLWPLVERAEDKILSDFSSDEAALFIKGLKQVQQKCVEIIGES